MRQTFDILIVGGGHGGAQVAIALRHAKFEGSIAIVGDEPEYPYERPPLSKDYFAGEKPFERILLRPVAFWDERSITMLLGHRVTVVDADAHEATTADGMKLAYTTLIWATGGVPRKLTCRGSELGGVHTVRTRADVDAMKTELVTTTNIVVIGGGYIGLEAAAVLSKFGKHVTLLEALPRVLARVAGEQLSSFYEAEHRAHGVDVHLNAMVDCLEGQGHVSGVRLASGDILPADMVIVGIGIIAAIEPLITAGAEGSNGVAVDQFCRTSLPDVYAIGDCALHPNDFAGSQSIRLESVQNANDQATCVARAIMGDPQPYHAVPWFWSNQYDLRLQTVGLSTGYDDAVLRGEPVARSFSVVYLKEGRVIALDCVNAVKDYVQGRSLVTSRAPVSREALADSTRPLKDIASELAI